MRTWHQDQNPPARYDHDTLWTAYHNEYGRPASVMRFENAEDCYTYCKITGDTVLPPRKGKLI